MQHSFVIRLVVSAYTFRVITTRNSVSEISLKLPAATK